MLVPWKLKTHTVKGKVSDVLVQQIKNNNTVSIQSRVCCARALQTQNSHCKQASVWCACAVQRMLLFFKIVSMQSCVCCTCASQTQNTHCQHTVWCACAIQRNQHTQQQNTVWSMQSLVCCACVLHNQNTHCKQASVCCLLLHKQRDEILVHCTIKTHTVSTKCCLLSQKQRDEILVQCRLKTHTVSTECCLLSQKQRDEILVQSRLKTHTVSRQVLWFLVGTDSDQRQTDSYFFMIHLLEETGLSNSVVKA